MGVTGYDYVFVAVALAEEYVEESGNGFDEVFDARADEQLEVDEHLVVARASGVDFLANVAEPACEHEFDLRVDIFDAFLDSEVAFGDFTEDVAECVGQRRELVG